jgi:hypothetical protein
MKALFLVILSFACGFLMDECNLFSRYQIQPAAMSLFIILFEAGISVSNQISSNKFYNYYCNCLFMSACVFWASHDALIPSILNATLLISQFLIYSRTHKKRQNLQKPTDCLECGLQIPANRETCQCGWSYS